MNPAKDVTAPKKKHLGPEGPAGSMKQMRGGPEGNGPGTR